MVTILELLAKLIIAITKAIFKVTIVAVLIFFAVSYTNVGGNIDVLKEKYYYATDGGNLNPSSVMNDLEVQVEDSLKNMNNVSNMLNN